MTREETMLRNVPVDEHDYFSNGDPFETGVGHFWGLIETRDYMRARCAVIKALETIGTQQSLNEAVDHIFGCLTLCRGDNMGLRDLAPSMMLRIGQDQACYDFIKW